MKKRILSLVLCAALLLSLCLFMGAGMVEDTTANGSAETTETVVSTSGAPEFQSVGPFMTYFPGSSTVRKAPVLRAAAKDTSDGASNAVDVTKTATATDKKDADGNPIYQIDLTAAAKSNIVTYSKACDIVLVLDRSRSMNFSLTGSDNNSKERVEALQTAVNAFLTTIQKSSPTSRVAIVSYASDVTIDSGTKTASGALIPVTADNTVNSALTQIVSGLSTRCNGGTQSGMGMQQAVNIFNSVSASDSNYDNTRVTVLFTDGKPGNNYWSGEDEGYDVAQQSVHWSVILKHAKGDTVNMQANVEGQDFYGQHFQVGVWPFNDKEYGVSNYQDFRKGSTEQNDWNWTGCGSTVYSVGLALPDDQNQKAGSEGCKINEYLYRVSSHRPDGSHVTNETVNTNNPEEVKDPDGWGKKYFDYRTRNQPNGYYLTTSNADELEKIFTNIAQQTGEAVKDVTIRDEISESFVPCDAAGNAYNVGDTITSNGKTGTVRQEANGNYYIEWTEVTLTPKQVNQDGSTAQEAQTFSGTLYVKPKDGFLGGNNVPTNGSESGVYTAAGEAVKKFPQPEVNVPIKMGAFEAQTRNIYYGNAAPTLPELSTATPLEAWQTRYVTITRTSNTDVSNTTDGEYAVTVTVTPEAAKETSAGAPAIAQTATVNSVVHVYKPEITFNDSRINYGDTADYNNNGGAVVWKHGNDVAVAANMTGEAPALTYAYDPAAAAFTKDTYVKVTVTSDKDTATTKISDAVTFVHTADTVFPGCSFDSTKGQFIVHINVFDLTIQKTAKAGTTIDPNQTFVFKVKNNDNGKTMEIVITGAGQKTVKGLPMGSYTITEDTGWSWQYHPTEATQTITVSETSKTVTFENEKTPTNWLTSLADVINTWISGNAAQKN